MLLPTVPSVTTRKRSASGSSTTADTKENPASPFGEEGEDEDDEGEACVFGLDVEDDAGLQGFDESDGFRLEMMGLDDCGSDDEAIHPVRGDEYKLDLVGLGDVGENEEPAMTSMKTGSLKAGSLRTKSAIDFAPPESPKLGASPVLLSALERVALEIGHSDRDRSHTL